MDTKQINIVWCDDKIDTLYDESKRECFSRYNCALVGKAKNSNQLEEILRNKKGCIDAVIVDFNVGENTLAPDEDNAGGFRWIHDHLKDYVPIPFYLYTARDEKFIIDTYRRLFYLTKNEEDDENIKKNDYFFGLNNKVSTRHNRIFYSTTPKQLDALLEMINEEVVKNGTREFYVRQEYHEAFAAIEGFKLSPNIFTEILLSNEHVDIEDLCTYANSLRKVMESMVSTMANEGVIPIWFKDNLNGVPKLLNGRDNDYKKYYSEEVFMPKALFLAFELFLNYTQDGSHKKDHLPIYFEEYLVSTADIYIVKALAIIFLDVIKWTYSSFYRKCIGNPPFNIYKLKVIGFDENDRAIASYNGESNNKLFVPQPKNKDILQVGTNLEIRVDDIYQIDKSSKFFCNRWKAQLNKPIIGTVSEVRDDGAIIKCGEESRKIFVPQPKLQEGTTIEIHKIATTNPNFGDFYCTNYKILSNN